MCRRLQTSFDRNSVADTLTAAVAQIRAEMTSAINNRTDQLNSIETTMQNIATDAASAAKLYRMRDLIPKHCKRRHTREKLHSRESKTSTSFTTTACQWTALRRSIEAELPRGVAPHRSGIRSQRHVRRKISVRSTETTSLGRPSTRSTSTRADKLMPESLLNCR